MGVDCDRGRLAWSWWYFVLSIRFGLSRSPHWVIVWLAELLGREEPGFLVCSGVNSYSETLGCVLADGLVVCVVVFSEWTLGACPRAGRSSGWLVCSLSEVGLFLGALGALLLGALLLRISWVACPS